MSILLDIFQNSIKGQSLFDIFLVILYLKVVTIFLNRKTLNTRHCLFYILLILITLNKYLMILNSPTPHNDEKVILEQKSIKTVRYWDHIQKVRLYFGGFLFYFICLFCLYIKICKKQQIARLIFKMLIK